MSGKFLLGFDVGSSSVKASLLDSGSGKSVASASSPENEMEIRAPRPGWAEQDPEAWWTHMARCVAKLRAVAPDAVAGIAAVGVSYQMHGLVIVDEGGRVLRPSIIWCDGRAVPYGEKAFKELGRETCLGRLLNSPGNFTAAKLAWVKENEPAVYAKSKKMFLPGDYLAYRMTGEAATTASGLSEGVLWDSSREEPAGFLMDHFGFDRGLLPKLVPTFGEQGRITSSAAKELGLPAGVTVTYRAGDQPNNALSLGVLEPGELAATAGTSGVVYGIVDEPVCDPESRTNTFVHVNHEADRKRYGMLLCLNGTGSLNRWLRQTVAEFDGKGLSYAGMNELASKVPVGSAGLVVLPYGNGAERTLGNLDPGASVHGINFNIHGKAHLFRAGQEGIVFALAYGIEIMRAQGLRVDTVKAGYANMFLSPLFRTAFATVTGARVLLYETDGAEGAARGAGIGAGMYRSAGEAFAGLGLKETIEPDEAVAGAYREAYEGWKRVLKREVPGV